MYTETNIKATTSDNAGSFEYKPMFSLSIKKNINNRKADLNYDIELILYKLGFIK